MNFDYSSFVTKHTGHNLVLLPNGTGYGAIHCLTCGVGFDIEVISAKIKPTDALELDATKRTAYAGVKQI